MGRRSSDRRGLGNEAGLFPGSVITVSIPGARWPAWPTGHPWFGGAAASWTSLLLPMTR